MKINDIGLFRNIARDLSWLGQRQKTLATNIANANTPDYQSVDLKPLDFKEVLAQSAPLQLTTTDAMHRPSSRKPDEAATPRKDGSWEVAPDGNSVILEQQMLKVVETQADYQMSTELYRKHIAMLKMAIGARSS